MYSRSNVTRSDSNRLEAQMHEDERNAFERMEKELCALKRAPCVSVAIQSERAK